MVISITVRSSRAAVGVEGHEDVVRPLSKELDVRSRNIALARGADLCAALYRREPTLKGLTTVGGSWQYQRRALVDRVCRADRAAVGVVGDSVLRTPVRVVGRVACGHRKARARVADLRAAVRRRVPAFQPLAAECRCRQGLARARAGRDRSRIRSAAAVKADRDVQRPDRVQRRGAGERHVRACVPRRACAVCLGVPVQEGIALPGRSRQRGRAGACVARADRAALRVKHQELVACPRSLHTGITGNSAGAGGRSKLSCCSIRDRNAVFTGVGIRIRRKGLCESTRIVVRLAVAVVQYIAVRFELHTAVHRWPTNNQFRSVRQSDRHGRPAHVDIGNAADEVCLIAAVQHGVGVAVGVIVRDGQAVQERDAGVVVGIVAGTGSAPYDGARIAGRCDHGIGSVLLDTHIYRDGLGVVYRCGRTQSLIIHRHAVVMIADGVLPSLGKGDAAVCHSHCRTTAVLRASDRARSDRRSAVLLEGRVIPGIDRLAAARHELDLQLTGTVLVAVLVAARGNVVSAGHRPCEHRRVGDLCARVVFRLGVAGLQLRGICIRYGINIAVDCEAKHREGCRLTDVVHCIRTIIMDIGRADPIIHADDTGVCILRTAGREMILTVCVGEHLVLQLRRVTVAHGCVFRDKVVLGKRAVDIDVRISRRAVENNAEAVLRVDGRQVRHRHAAAVADLHVAKDSAREDRVGHADVRTVNAHRSRRAGDTAVRDLCVIIADDRARVIILTIFTRVTRIGRPVDDSVVDRRVRQADDAERLAADVAAGAVDLKAVAVEALVIQRQRRVCT